MNSLKVTGMLVLIVLTLWGCSKYGTEPAKSGQPSALTNLEKPSGGEDIILNPSNGHYYEAVPISEGITWDDAYVAAQIRKTHGLPGHLAVVTSQEENDFIVDNLPQAFPANKAGFWLGGFQQIPNSAPDAGWRWVTGEPFNFTKWGTGEPNDELGNVEEDVLHYDWLSNSPKGCWNDISRPWLLTGYVVEYEKPDHTMVTICHKPGTPAQKTMVIPIQALAAHLRHGDELCACCSVTQAAEYVISGGTDPDAGIYVDDMLWVYVNENLVAEIESQGGQCCPPANPLHFIADTGDILRVQAQDANNCYSLEALWLQKTDGSCLTQIAPRIYGPNCGSEVPEQIFYDETFILP